ncbi:Thymidylate kinase [archaeon HR01]|nr:Thymidylate kinase [archaeon HR01]
MTFTVVWEGLDGAGKTSLMTETMKVLKIKGLTVTSYKTPSNTSIGEFAFRVGNSPETDPLTRMLLFLANTSSDSKIIRDMMVRDRPDLLFIDRYYLCSIVYGVSLLSIHNPELEASKTFEDWFKIVESSGRSIFINPDLYIIVNVDEETRIRRLILKGRTADSRFSEDRKLMETVLGLYRHFREKHSEKTMWVENLENLLSVTAENIAEKIIEKLREKGWGIK